MSRVNDEMSALRASLPSLGKKFDELLYGKPLAEKIQGSLAGECDDPQPFTSIGKGRAKRQPVSPALGAPAEKRKDGPGRGPVLRNSGGMISPPPQPLDGGLSPELEQRFADLRGDIVSAVVAALGPALRTRDAVAASPSAVSSAAGPPGFGGPSTGGGPSGRAGRRSRRRGVASVLAPAGSVLSASVEDSAEARRFGAVSFAEVAGRAPSRSVPGGSSAKSGRCVAPKPGGTGRKTGGAAAGGGRRSGIRVPSQSVVSLSVREDAEGSPSYASVLREARSGVSLKELDIVFMRMRRSYAGGLLLQISGKDAERKAGLLANRLGDLFSEREGVRISLPRRTEEVRLRGFLEYTSREEVIQGIVAATGCSQLDFKVGDICIANKWGFGSVWLRCPAVAARILTRDGLLVGLTRLTASLLSRRPMQCFRCLEFGHTVSRCGSKENRGDLCYRCGMEGHKAAGCTAPPIVRYVHPRVK